MARPANNSGVLFVKQDQRIETVHRRSAADVEQMDGATRALGQRWDETLGEQSRKRRASATET